MPIDGVSGTMNKDTINLIKDSASTFLNIAQMTQYLMRYMQDRGAEARSHSETLITCPKRFQCEIGHE